ncbi:MAG: transcription elongation factor Spt5 [Desulfurococcales archaeon]|nr:transcription elongation factor Spt5 [Desulfurococcales archaeon]MCE4626471.1 transcription elongation factor Spt5 [Desulfurococcales archaeon]MCE4629690.1 transcription elongation factor Spt5 [Desulfurococcales archaeon]
MSSQVQPSRFYAIYVTGGTEERVALILRQRTLAMGLDVRSIIVPLELRGTLIIEVGNPGDLFDLIRGLRDVKRRRPVLIKKEEAVRLAAPVVEVPLVSKDQIVEIVSGPFRGMKGKVVEVYETRGEVDLVLLESDFRMIITVPLEQIRPVSEEA